MFQHEMRFATVDHELLARDPRGGHSNVLERIYQPRERSEKAQRNCCLPNCFCLDLTPFLAHLLPDDLPTSNLCAAEPIPASPGAGKTARRLPPHLLASPSGPYAFRPRVD